MVGSSDVVEATTPAPEVETATPVSGVEFGIVQSSGDLFDDDVSETWVVNQDGALVGSGKQMESISEPVKVGDRLHFAFHCNNGQLALAVNDQVGTEIGCTTHCTVCLCEFYG